MIHSLNHAWGSIEHLVDKLSIQQTAAISGTGAVTSLATAAVAPDFTAINAYLQLGTFVLGFCGAALAAGLPILKLWLERRASKKANT